ncbi:MAG: FAD-binding oxidoreductase [Candidatus Omnitrophica bacterium]|nr:FAD-binding oxidoreductase [Candidatus Omnitrophota bacterium]
MLEIDAKIKEVIQRTYNVKSFRLDIAGEPVFEAGQFCCVRLLTEKECKRYLSISSSPTEKGYLEFTKKITESDFSKILQTLGPGDKLKLRYPFGKFTLAPADTKIAFLSGGIGITPIRSIAKYVVDKKLDKDIILLYANHTVKDIVFKEEFDLLQRECPKLKVRHVLSEAAPGFDYVLGRINAQAIKNEIADYPQRRFYLCGPPAMVEAMENILRGELALPAESIVRENFQGY